MLAAMTLPPGAMPPAAKPPDPVTPAPRKVEAPSTDRLAGAGRRG